MSLLICLAKKLGRTCKSAGFHQWGLAAGVHILGAPVISRPALSDSTDVIPKFVTNLCLHRPSGMCCRAMAMDFRPRPVATVAVPVMVTVPHQRMAPILFQSSVFFFKWGPETQAIQVGVLISADAEDSGF